MVKKDVAAYKTIYEETRRPIPPFSPSARRSGRTRNSSRPGSRPYQDACNIHVYNGLGELRKSMQRYRELFAKYGGKKPIWATEIGSNSQGLTRNVIAQDIIRKAVCFMADGGEFFHGSPRGDARSEGRKGVQWLQRFHGSLRQQIQHVPRRASTPWPTTTSSIPFASRSS